MEFLRGILERIEYRDPLFGIVVVIFCIGLVSLFAHYWNYIIAKRQRNSLAKFLESFEYIGFDKEVKEFLALNQNPFPPLLFVAKMYQTSANYEKAIGLYTTLLDFIPNPADKIPILEALGQTYIKAGFLLRAKEVYLQILQHYPRNIQALKSLIKIYEELKSFEDAINALECLEEVQGSTHLYKLYLQAKILILSQKPNNPQRLLELLQKEPRLARLILNFLKDFSPTLFWDSLNQLPKDIFLDIQDLIWNLKEIPPNFLKNIQDAQETENLNTKILKDILEAKGILPLSFSQKATFELETICLLRTHKSFQGDLRFAYQCASCKGISPFSFDRCPHCGELLTSKTLVFLKEKQDEMCYSLL